MAKRRRRKPAKPVALLDTETRRIYDLGPAKVYLGGELFGKMTIPWITPITPEDTRYFAFSENPGEIMRKMGVDVPQSHIDYMNQPYLEKLHDFYSGSLGQSYDQWKAHQFSVDLHRHLVLSAPYGKPGRDLEAEMISGLAHKVERQKALIETIALLPGTSATTTRYETTWWDQPVIKKPRDPYADIIKIWENMNAMTRQRRAAIRRAAMSEASRSLFPDANAQAGVAALRKRYPTMAEPWKDVKPAARVDPATVREAIKQFLGRTK